MFTSLLKRDAEKYAKTNFNMSNEPVSKSVVLYSLCLLEHIRGFFLTANRLYANLKELDLNGLDFWRVLKCLSDVDNEIPIEARKI